MPFRFRSYAFATSACSRRIPFRRLQNLRWIRCASTNRFARHRFAFDDICVHRRIRIDNRLRGFRNPLLPRSAPTLRRLPPISTHRIHDYLLLFRKAVVRLFYLTRLVKRLDLLDFQYTISAPDAQVTIVRLLFPFFAHLRSQRRDFSLSCRLRRLIDRRLHNVIRFFSYQRALFVSCIPDRK